MTTNGINGSTNPRLKLALEFIRCTNQNIFLTGRAGTGKTTFLKNLKAHSPKRMVVVAPTGVAAINAGGVTIHSFFQLPFGPQLPFAHSGGEATDNQTDSARSRQFSRFSKTKINLIKSLNLLVIDEISMVRADLLDAIDRVLRRFRNRYLPFGGIQLLMIGDLQQLAPVVKDNDWEILKKYYDTCFFFSSKALRQASFIGIELQHIYRQSDQRFIDLLNKVRDNKLDTDDLRMLNKRYIPGFSPKEEEGFITLTTHNFQAKQINDKQLGRLPGKEKQFKCEIDREFPAMAFPADEVLAIKKGAQVMFLRNDISPEKRYFNGKIGKVVSISDNEIEVQCPDDAEPITVTKATWENTKYTLNEMTSEIEEEVVGTFIQFPLKLAWAITIHKSQGLTFEKAIIDARQSFAHGQVYVALSRCKSLEGLILSTPLNEESVINDDTVTGFINDVEQNQPDETELRKHRKGFELQLMLDLFDFSAINRNIDYILKYWSDNNTILLGNLKQKLEDYKKQLETEIGSVASKFRPQIMKLASLPVYAEENHTLQERLTKGAAYFLKEFTQLTASLLEDSGFECDNKAVKKRLSEMQDGLENEIEIKRACLGSALNGFDLQALLAAKAVAAIEKPETKTRSETAGMKLSHPDFYRTLIQWRIGKSNDTGMDQSKILSQKLIVNIAETLPPTAMELKKIKGMGGKKMKQFGSDLLALILNYRKEKGMEVPLNATQEIAFAGLDTKEITLALFRQGIPLPEIAAKRNFNITTIEGHLSHFVENGMLDVFELIDQKKYQDIAQIIKDKTEDETLTHLKEKLGAAYSYGEMRLVMAHLKSISV